MLFMYWRIVVSVCLIPEKSKENKFELFQHLRAQLAWIIPKKDQNHNQEKRILDECWLDQMNVVVKVGSLISQGVYSVATPFHPFGGAVDVIVVQQQDGTFRSTPWYVRFGKFQGVLKGAEKMVRINVNGVDANFHMYLDNSGEAYFVKEVDSGKGSETNGVVKDSVTLEPTQEESGLDIDNQNNGNENVLEIRRLEHSVSDSMVVQLRDERDSLGANLIQRAESDSDRRYYEFKDQQSSLEGSVELSEYGSSRYDNLDSNHIVESQNLNSEVILVSVDGHVLTAPISVSELSTEDVQDTPRFNLGPGEETDFCEGNEEFSSGETAWAADYICKLNESTTSDASGNVCGVQNEDNVIGRQLEVDEGGRGLACQAQETQKTSRQERDLQMHRDSEDASTNKADVFESCLGLEEMAKRGGKADVEDMGSSLEVQNSPEKSNQTLPDPVVDRTEDASVIELRNDNELSASCGSVSPDNNMSPHVQVGSESVEKIVSSLEQMSIESISVHSVSNDPDWKDEQCVTSAAVDETESSQQIAATGDECSKSELIEPPTESSRFEISLCGNELRVGMGVKAAAEAFAARRVSAQDFITSATSILKNENLIIRYRERYFLWEKAAPVVLGMAAFDLDLPVAPEDAIPVEQDGSEKPRDEDSGMPSTPTGRRWRLWPIPFRRVKTLEHTSSNSSNEDEFVDSESGLQNSQLEATPESPKSNLVWGTQQVDAHIYLWKWNARIVISDVDGTITKSDVLGQFMPLVGKDWTQSGVARLFCAIKENGYQLLFLSARAIVQAYLTRSFLVNLKQDGKALPNGPVVISPDGLFPSLYREVCADQLVCFYLFADGSCKKSTTRIQNCLFRVVIRDNHILQDIKKLFPSDYNPFYAGFGNRDTDELSYRKIGIPKGKIFIINPKGEVAISHHRADVKTYTSLHTLVNDMFPPTSLVEQNINRSAARESSNSGFVFIIDDEPGFQHICRKTSTRGTIGKCHCQTLSDGCYLEKTFPFGQTCRRLGGMHIVEITTL
ncbi:Lipin family protein [Prunus dulcis]|uniref:phosphatidate phosphatase n=1 Tax=Prunus dulcis TaxID=3755 RepID=A0A4Y1RQD7_PRUDU|nr:Lipin family protein [Prunus dulcis]